VVEHAQQRLLELESSNHHPEPQMTLFQPTTEHPLVAALKDIDPDDLSPRQAQQALYNLKEQADQELHS
jgi:DNA mismatch repair protein MutS